MQRLLPLLLLVFLFACEKDEGFTPALSVDPDRVNFSSPAVGQFNTYRFLHYICGEAVQNTQDELRLEITNVNDAEIEFTETWGDQSHSYLAKREPDRLVIAPEDRQRSSLFYSYGSDYFNFSTRDGKTITQSDCAFYDGEEKFIGIFRTPTFRFTADKTYQGDYAVVCVPMILEQEGYLIYDRNTLTATMVTSESSVAGETTRFTSWLVLEH